MQQAFFLAKQIFFTLLFAVLLFLFLITPARAPKGSKGSLGGRTIASLQEEDFDKKLLSYQICYGITFVPGPATIERRRVCKAMLVSKLEALFAKRGAYLTHPVEFECRNTVIDPGRRPSSTDENSLVLLKPNQEFTAIDAALNYYSDSISVDPEREYSARDVCSFLTDCKDSLELDHFSARKTVKCLLTKDSTRRNRLLDVIGNMLFSTSTMKGRILFAELLKEQ